MMSTEFIHYATIALTVALNAVGVSIGQGLTSSWALKEVNTQPGARDDIIKTAILSMALIETSAVMGALVAVLLYISPQSACHNNYVCLAQIGIGLAVGVSGLTIGIASAFPARAACTAIARQPFSGQKILRFLLITLSLIQTPVVFGIIVALFILGQLPNVMTLRESARLIAAGLCIGVGSVGPTIGLSLFASAACGGIGINRKAYGKLLPFTLISQAIIETPILFALVVAIILLFVIPHSGQENFLETITFLSAALCTGLGTFGPGISSGRTAASACHQIALQPHLHTKLSHTCMFAQGLIETCAIYPVIISIALLFVAR